MFIKNLGSLINKKYKKNWKMNNKKLSQKKY